MAADSSAGDAFRFRGDGGPHALVDPSEWTPAQVIPLAFPRAAPHASRLPVHEGAVAIEAVESVAMDAGSRFRWWLVHKGLVPPPMPEVDEDFVATVLARFDPVVLPAGFCLQQRRCQCG